MKHKKADLSARTSGEQLAGAWCGGWFADDRYPEAGRGEGVGHRVQRPVPETHQSGLAAHGPLFGVVVGREIVGLAAGLAVHDVNRKGMVDGHAWRRCSKGWSRLASTQQS
jgi:hypothetical protein